jgi:ubiquinone/menaquinone biosynthesis C-methylase UbiE
MYNFFMRSETLPLLCNPFTGEPLRLEENQLIGIDTNQSFPIKNGIPSFILKDDLKGRSKWFRHFYDAVAFAYDSIVDLGDILRINSEGNIRQEYISRLDIHPGEKVLETAVGTASNFLFLPSHGEYFGIDISLNMLNRAQKKLTSAHRKAELFHGDGAYLPFKDETFDLVFHMGGLQFYSDPYRGVSEMARVAKSGTIIHILDEIKSIKRTLRQNPSKYCEEDSALTDLHLLLPNHIEEPLINQFPGNDFYLITFVKPKI